MNRAPVGTTSVTHRVGTVGALGAAGRRFGKALERDRGIIEATGTEPEGLRPAGPSSGAATHETRGHRATREETLQ
jgi:hypothetical protein